jgi:hypothetical protein
MSAFSPANTKLRKLSINSFMRSYLKNGRKVYSFDLLSGFSCPMALLCLAKAIVSEHGRRIQDGKHQRFRCFSASQEVAYPSTYRKRKRNFDAMRGFDNVEEAVQFILSHLPHDAGVVRIHVSGDFFNWIYFQAWCIVARDNPSILFYAYTKSLDFLLRGIDEGIIPDNLNITASRGGRLDHMIDEHGLKEAVVCFSKAEAKAKGLPIDKDDSHAAHPRYAGKSFALLIHGQQPAGSEAAAAVKELRKSA